MIYYIEMEMEMVKTIIKEIQPYIISMAKELA